MIIARTLKRVIGTAALAALAMLLAACAAQTTQTAAQADEEAEVVRTWEPWDGDGMEIPLDGSSLEAFETSLARVEAHTTPENYTTLVNAIEYLLFYDLTAKRDRATLASNLDGLTPNEVIAKVNWRREWQKESAPERRTSDAARDL